MTSIAWPFLIARSKSIDYRTLVAPDFMVNASCAKIISENAGGGDENKLMTRIVKRSPVGSLSIFYRNIPVVYQGVSLKDEFGRQIHLVEGLVCKGRVEDADISMLTLDQTHELVYDTFVEFWEADKVIPVVSSSARDLTSPWLAEADVSMIPGNSYAAVLQWVVNTFREYPRFWRYSFIIILMFFLGALSKSNQELRAENTKILAAIEKSGCRINVDLK